MPDERKRPLVVLGIDAGDPVFIERWAQQGYLPTIDALMKRGTWARTSGPELISEHGVWISLFSGLSRSQHGYYYFRQLKPGTYDLESASGSDIAARPFWSYLEGQPNCRAVIVDPPDEGVRANLAGIQVTNWATHNNWNPEHYRLDARPRELLRELEVEFGHQQVTQENHQSTFEQDREIFQALLPRIKRKGALCRHLFAKGTFDLYLTVMAETHVACHQFWKYCPDVPANRGQPENELTHAIREVYQAVDRELGRLLGELPKEANVVLVSSVGMADDYPFTGISEQFFRKLGYQAKPPPAGLSLRPMALARRVLPESLRVALSRNLSRRKREQLLAQQFRSGTDWAHTTAFAMPSAYTTFVRVNLRGREPQGVVGRNGEYDALLNVIENDFRQLIDPETGNPAVERIAKTVELFGGGPPAVLPDLFVDWVPGKFTRRVIHPRATLEQGRPEFYRRSDHGSHGFFAATGPDIEPAGHLSDIDVLDVAPTLLGLLGQPMPRAMRGKPLRQATASC